VTRHTRSPYQANRAAWLTVRVFLLLLLGAGASGAWAQGYRFAVPEAEVTVTIGEDGSALIHYKLTFECQRVARSIDVVDIGMPNMGRHSPGGAAVDGTPLPKSSIKISEFLKPRGCGYEVHLGGHAIQPGRRAVFEFTGREERMVWQDTTNPDWASFRFTPTWFGAQYLVGDTNLILRYKLPIPAADYPAVKENIRWQRKGEDFSAKGVMEDEDVASVAWVRTVRLTGPHMFSVSFPKRYVTSIRKDTVWAVVLRWFKGTPEAQVTSGIILFFLFAILFFMATRGTGWSVFFVLEGLMIFGMVTSPAFHLWLYPIMLALLVLGLLVRARRKKRYFPAELCVEGGGIKRGLTAVEAAVLLEVPLNKILTMVVFGLAKKGVVRVRFDNPLKLEVTGKGKGKTLWERADGKTVKLRAYEPGFIKEFQAQQQLPVEEMDLNRPMDALAKRVVGHTAGFSLQETRAYYRSIVSRAWRQVQSEADYEARFNRVDKQLSWLMLDDGWERELDDVSKDYHYYPVWWYGRPVHTGHAIPRAPVAVPDMPSAPQTSFGDVANSLVGRFESASSSLVGSLDSLGTTSKGGIDLSGFDRITGEVLKGLAEGSGGGGGGCAGGGCACAGCACACACAGGGR